jgi:hypothetical protein
MTGREGTWRTLSTLGGIVAYGCLAAFLCLVGTQIYWWFKEGEWTHVSLGDGIRAVLDRMHVADGAAGPLARLYHWLDAPVDWLGLHKVVEILPASLALFAVAMLGNFVLVYGTDRLRETHRPG